MSEGQVLKSRSQDVDCCQELLDVLRLRVERLRHDAAVRLDPDLSDNHRYFLFGELRAFRDVLQVLTDYSSELSSIT